jgi:hypothetical protein
MREVNRDLDSRREQEFCTGDSQPDTAAIAFGASLEACL